MPKLYLDFEVQSEVNVEDVGIDNYAKHPSTRVSLMGSALEDEEVLITENIVGTGVNPLCPPLWCYDLRNPDLTIVCWNSTFERYILKYVLEIDLPAERFEDPMVQAKHLSMPGKLETVCEILELEEGKIDGKKLIKRFCEPAHKGGEETLFGISKPRFNDRDSHPQEWEDFKAYCKRDVEVLRKISKLFSGHPLPEVVRRGWLLDQKINDHGMPVDLQLVHKLDEIAERRKKETTDQIIKISGIENPNSNPQMLEWLRTQGYAYNSLGKPFVNMALEDIELSREAAEVLELRKESAKTSDSKFQALKLAVSSDGFVRDQFSYLGAGRTGRWAGRTVQLQNLPRPTQELDKNLDKAIEMVMAGDYEGLKKWNIMDVVASCIRPCLKAPEGYKFVLCDLAAIEHRVVGWVSGCQSILDVHRQGKDPYVDFAALLYKIPYEQMIVIVNGVHKCRPEYKDMRQNAKPPVLGCGFGLSGGELYINKDGDELRGGLWGYAKHVCNVDMPKDLAHKAVGLYQGKYPEVVDFWYDIEDAAIDCVRSRRTITLKKVVLDCHGKTFRIKLPSGRFLHYIRPQIKTVEKFGKMRDVLTFEGIGANHHWCRQETYGGKLTENVVQAIARDILLEGMFNSDAAGQRICGLFHDELAVLAPASDTKALEILRSSMVKSPAWAKDLPLGAEGFETIRYRKG